MMARLLWGFFFMLQVTSLNVENNQARYGIAPGSEMAQNVTDATLQSDAFGVDHSNTTEDTNVYAPARAHMTHCSRKRNKAVKKVIEEYLTPFVEQENFDISRKCGLYQDDVKCLADACGALHCELVMDLKVRSYETNCNPGKTEKNRQLCESLADSCFPAYEGSSASRLHDLFLRQFCDAHTCSDGPKPFSIRGKNHGRSGHLDISVLIVLLLIFCLIIVWHHIEMRRCTQDLKYVKLHRHYR